MTCSQCSTGEVCQLADNMASLTGGIAGEKNNWGRDSSLILHQELRSLTKDERSKVLLDAGLTIDFPSERASHEGRPSYSMEQAKGH